jgi:hypothetical protein
MGTEKLRGELNILYIKKVDPLSVKQLKMHVMSALVSLMCLEI